MKRFERIRLHKWVRMILIGGLGVLSLVGIGVIVKEVRAEHIQEQQRSLYDYRLKSAFNYQVYLLPNKLYEEGKQGEEETYLAEFVDKIEIGLESVFEGSEVADIQGQYQIAGTVQGYTTKEEKKQIIWSKTFEILPSKSFKEHTDKHHIKPTIQVDFAYYNQFARDIIEASQVNTPVELVIKLEGKQTITTQAGIVPGEIQGTITIPLNTAYFSIKKEGGAEVKDSLWETYTVPIPINIQIIILGVFMMILGVILLGGVILLTEPLSARDLRFRQLKRLLNNYGNRMVAIDTLRPIDTSEGYYVSSLEDLIKIADEIEKPVFYQRYNKLLELDTFYVEQEKVTYIYKLEAFNDGEYVKEQIEESIS
ncbi:hypothetical protein CS063_10260 [Sporanaerobium hydrogeniformans]|uniref:Uncharacterized protein n=1 Tax=Sporanaerobium hydrogeniformans TaxID=3072179 RepID=A0AC61DCJ6_9FIRM|nr:DUF5305 family protein [Sporanaerobium hydrogeniformans]PHV70463.1 hypothetical protein CS063_10260 [Sporanaerobium hydrogeniformans]